MLCTLEKICRLMRAGSCHAERERNNAEAKLMAIKLARDSSQVNEARLPFAIRLVVVLFLLLEILTLENWRSGFQRDGTRLVDTSKKTSNWCSAVVNWKQSVSRNNVKLFKWKRFLASFFFVLKDMGKRFAHWHRVSISVWSCWTRTNFDTFELACFFFSRRTSSAGDAVWRFFLQPDMSNNMPRQTDGSCRFFYSPFLFFNFFCFFSFCMTKNVFFRTKPPHPHVGQFQMWKNASWPFDGRPSHRLVGGGGERKNRRATCLYFSQFAA